MTFFDLARRNVSRHWLRSTLAVIGIVIGVIAIASMGILGNSIGLMFEEMVTDVGDTIVVYPASGSGTMAFTERQVRYHRAPLQPRHTVCSTFNTVTVGETKSA